MKKITFIPLISLLLAASLFMGVKTQDATLSRVAAVCLWAENIHETAEFYQKLLELQEPPTEQNNRIRLRLNRAVFFILKGKPCSAESDNPFPLFAFTVNDLDMAESFLKTHNIKIPHGIEGSGHHRELQFYDPAGNLLELVQNR